MQAKPNLTRKRVATRSLTDSEGGLVAPALMIAANLIRRAGNLTYKAQLGLSAVEWTLIARLGKGGPMTQTALAEVSQFDKGQISRATSQLELKRLITRKKLTWRSEELRLAEAGMKVYNEIARMSRQRQLVYTKNVSERELRQFNKTLDIIVGNANDLLGSLRKQGYRDAK
jgi:DNA-binding MarR family transcriptional regulator